MINNKSQDRLDTHLRCGEIFTSLIFTNFLLSLPVKKILKSAHIWQNCRQECGLHVDECVQKQFPVMLMIHMCIIEHSVGCAIRTVWKYFCRLTN